MGDDPRVALGLLRGGAGAESRKVEQHIPDDRRLEGWPREPGTVPLDHDRLLSRHGHVEKVQRLVALPLGGSLSLRPGAHAGGR